MPAELKNTNEGTWRGARFMNDHDAGEMLGLERAIDLPCLRPMYLGTSLLILTN